MNRAALEQATGRLQAAGYAYSTLFDGGHRGYRVIVQDGARRTELRTMTEVRKLTKKRKGAG